MKNKVKSELISLSNKLNKMNLPKESSVIMSLVKESMITPGVLQAAIEFNPKIKTLLDVMKNEERNLNYDTRLPLPWADIVYLKINNLVVEADGKVTGDVEEATVQIADLEVDGKKLHPHKIDRVVNYYKNRPMRGKALANTISDLNKYFKFNLSV